MGKKTKVGKRRQDRFYHLAKETGYRARSAFKLIQLNRKYGFLQESRVLVDLCAAPGGWLQVAANFMPVSSIIIGIDLVPIKSIRNVQTFQNDITSEACRQNLKKELKTWKADCFLNDGAPNVGTAWVQDAFTQSQLALSALKLACEFLKAGGCFITKIFRSKDYTSLMWVFQQLFKKVHATKPQASRNESAEIFVVCQGYRAPSKLDPKFVDPRHVFKELQDETKVKLNIFRPEKQTRNRQGYAEGDYILFNTTNVSEFIISDTPLELLATTNQLIFDDEKYSNHPSTKEEIKLCCKDIKVLGKREIKDIISWRKHLRKEFITNENDEKTDLSTKETNADTEEDSEEKVQLMISELKDEEAKDIKRKKRRVRENKKKLQEKLATKLVTTNETAGGVEEMDLFNLNIIENQKHLNKLDDAKMDDENADSAYFEDSDEELAFESENESEDNEYDYHDDDIMYGSKRPKFNDIDANEKEMARRKTMLDKKKKKIKPIDNPLLVELEKDSDLSTTTKTNLWFQKEVFKDIQAEEDEDYDVEQMMSDYKKKGTQIIGEENIIEKDKAVEVIKKADKKTEKSKNDGRLIQEENKQEEIAEDDSEESDDDDEDIDDRSISQGRKQENVKENKQKGDSFEIVPQNTQVTKYLTPQALALGAAMATSKKRKRDIIDDSYNRYTFGNEAVPSWFAEDETKHTKRFLPVTKEEVDFYKERLKEINARPSKKVIEAKARKKKKMVKKLDRARKKAEAIPDTPDVSQKEKMDQIKSIYKKAGLLKKTKIEKTYVVAKKALTAKKYKRPPGIKGIYKVVDPRMKKDLKAMQRKEQKGKKKRGKKK